MKKVILSLLLALSLAHYTLSTNYCRQTKCGVCKISGEHQTCERCVNSQFKQVPDKEGIWECVGSATGIENCIALHKPVENATKSGCYMCGKGFMLKAGDVVDGVTLYTCVAGTTDNCAWYSENGETPLDRCKYCDIGNDMDTNYACAAGTTIANCDHTSWDGTQIVCGVCNERWSSDSPTSCSAPNPANDSRNCRDAVLPATNLDCAECAWFAGGMVYNLNNGSDLEQQCHKYELIVGTVVDLGSKMLTTILVALYAMITVFN